MYTFSFDMVPILEKTARDFNELIEELDEFEGLDITVRKGDVVLFRGEV